jgi:hypothetical protein
MSAGHVAAIAASIETFRDGAHRHREPSAARSIGGIEGVSNV